MASRTYGKYTRGQVTINDYFDWRDQSSERAACERTTNPAFLDATASPADIRAAQETCAGCPLLTGCNFFAHTKHFKQFDGVMGGELHTNGLEERIEELA